MDRYSLLQRGLFPETLPPCFTTEDLKRALRGITPTIRSREFRRRQADYVRYNGTKHDRSRRYFGTPHPIAYFHVADFIHNHWTTFETKFNTSPFSVSRPKVGRSTDDRAVIIPSLSELTSEASRNLGHAPYVLKTDIAQFFPSIYTHSIPWAAHGIDAAKGESAPNASSLPFNALDFFVRNCQLAETRGVLVGPDAFRLVAEFIASGIDEALQARVGEHIVGAARHVDDFYIGLRSETDALIVLSALRELLQRYNLNVNDSKTKIMSALEPLNELWAQDLREQSRKLRQWGAGITTTGDEVILFLTRALQLAGQLNSDSPVKIALRTFDQIKGYTRNWWPVIEPYLQRIIFHHPHCIDYAALLVVKRFAIGESIDKEGWSAAAEELLKRHLAFNHHHEILWLVWMLLATEQPLSADLVMALCNNPNAHIRALMIAAASNGHVKGRLPLRLGSRLSSQDDGWLTGLVARATGYSGAQFSGDYADEFTHLANRHIVLIDLDAHVRSVRAADVHAISRTRYGYDNDDDDDDYAHDDDPF